MTPKQKAALAYWHYDAGVKRGHAFAQSIINEFPDGFDDAQCDRIMTHAKLALSVALTALPKRFRDEFGSGHWIGLRACLSKYQESLSLRAIGSKQVG